MALAMDYHKRVAQGHAKQQPTSTMRGQEGGATRGQQEMMARQPADGTRQQEGARQDDDKTTRGRRIKRGCKNHPAQSEDERVARGATRGRGEAMQHKLARRVDKGVVQQDDGMRLCDNQLAWQDDERTAQ